MKLLNHCCMGMDSSAVFSSGAWQSHSPVCAEQIEVNSFARSWCNLSMFHSFAVPFQPFICHYWRTAVSTKLQSLQNPMPISYNDKYFFYKKDSFSVLIYVFIYQIETIIGADFFSLSQSFSSWSSFIIYLSNCLETFLTLNIL